MKSKPLLTKIIKGGLSKKPYALKRKPSKERSVLELEAKKLIQVRRTSSNVQYLLKVLAMSFETMNGG